MANRNAIDRIVEVGRAAFPAVTVPAVQLEPVIARRLDEDDDPDALVADEVYLACACALAAPEALAAFEQRYFPVIAPALARMGLGRDDIRDVEQVLRVRLFVAEPGEPPRVVGYAGQGQLASLIRVAAVRAGLNLLRDTGRLERDADGLEALPVQADDPELARLKAQHREAFTAAFENAVAALTARERSLLGLAIVKRLGIDRIGTIYGVHRATAARWVAQARASLSHAVHRALGERLGVAAAELADLVPLVESQLELSLERLLRSRADASHEPEPSP